MRQGLALVVLLWAADGDKSEHLRSRNEVEETGGGRTEVMTLRASMIVGAGSDSFRTLARIVGRLPVLALPSWRSSRTQPIAIGDVIDALVAAPDVAPGTYEVGGADVGEQHVLARGEPHPDPESLDGSPQALGVREGDRVSGTEGDGKRLGGAHDGHATPFDLRGDLPPRSTPDGWSMVRRR